MKLAGAQIFLCAAIMSALSELPATEALPTPWVRKAMGKGKVSKAKGVVKGVGMGMGMGMGSVTPSPSESPTVSPSVPPTESPSVSPTASCARTIWTSGENNAVTGTLTVGSTDHNVTVTNLIYGGIDPICTLNTPEYAFSPSSSNTCVVYSSGSDWVATFNPPIANPLVIGGSWRGRAAGGPDPVIRTFDAPFTIASGFSASTASANALSSPQNTFHNGILQFSGTIAQIQLDTTALGSFEILTIGACP